MFRIPPLHMHFISTCAIVTLACALTEWPGIVPRVCTLVLFIPHASTSTLYSISPELLTVSIWSGLYRYQGLNLTSHLPTSELSPFSTQAKVFTDKSGIYFFPQTVFCVYVGFVCNMSPQSLVSLRHVCHLVGMVTNFSHFAIRL